MCHLEGALFVSAHATLLSAVLHWTAKFRAITHTPRMIALRLIALAILLSCVPACALRSHSTLVPGAPVPSMSELWAESDPSRNLFWGPGGETAAPSAQAEYQFVARDTTGKSPGYDVRDAQGRLWSVKLGPEAQSEVVVSRLLWAAGYFQPPTYYLPRWTLIGAPEAGPQAAGRFRLELDRQQKVGSWSWSANPFVGTMPLRGLFVLMVMVNNWDLKTQQNPLYELPGGSDGPLRRYVVRDLGASLGGTRWIFPGSKSDIDDFEKERFIHSVRDGQVRFHYRGAWREPSLKRGVTPADVRWISQRLERLTAAQWSDAFRAAGYSDADAGRFIVRLRQKVGEGLGVASGS